MATDIYRMMQDTQAAGERGYAQGQQRGLAGLMSKAMQAPRDQRQGIVSQMAATNPQAAFDAEAHFGQMDDNARKRLGQNAAMFMALPDEQKASAYPRLAMEAQAAGIPNVPLQYDPKFNEGLQYLAQAFGGAGGGAEQFTLNPGSTRYAADGSVIAAQPFAPQGFQGAWDSERGMWIPKPGGAPQAAPSQGPTGGAAQVLDNAYQGAMAPEQVQSTIQQLASEFGGQVSSLTRTPEHNREVGGVPGSQHIRGTAGDVVIRDPAQKAAYIRKAQSMGLQVIDEGDHLHTQLPRGAQTAQAGGLRAIPVEGLTPKPKPAPAGYRYGANGVSLEAIPGGPAEVAAAARRDAAAARKAAEDAKASQKSQAAKARQAESASTAGELVAAIDNLTKAPGFKGLGTAMGDLALRVPMARNDTKDADAQLKNIANQVVLATMSRLKALSAQGATGFGALSEKEMMVLQNSIATLQSDQISNKQLTDSLKVIRDKMQKVADWQEGGGKYTVGQIIEHGGKKYRVTDVSDPNDPDVEEVR